MTILLQQTVFTVVVNLSVCPYSLPFSPNRKTTCWCSLTWPTRALPAETLIKMPGPCVTSLNRVTIFFCPSPLPRTWASTVSHDTLQAYSITIIVYCKDDISTRNTELQLRIMIYHGNCFWYIKDACHRILGMLSCILHYLPGQLNSVYCHLYISKIHK